MIYTKTQCPPPPHPNFQMNSMAPVCRCIFSLPFEGPWLDREDLPAIRPVFISDLTAKRQLHFSGNPWQLPFSIIIVSFHTLNFTILLISISLIQVFCQSLISLSIVVLLRTHFQCSCVEAVKLIFHLSQL